MESSNPKISSGSNHDVSDHNPSEASNSQDGAETPILEYARNHGLCQDYLSRHPLEPSSLPSPIPEDGSDLIAFDKLPELELPSSAIPEDKWTLNQGGAAYLQLIHQLPKETLPYDFPTQRQTFRKMKMESPLLRTDPELDMRQLFATRPNKLDTRSLASEPFEPVISDGALQWPLSDSSLLSRIDLESRSETLQASFEQMLYLRDIMNAVCTEADVDQVIQQDMARKNHALPFMSPPLSPLSISSSFSEVDPVAFEMDLTSTPVDPSTEQLRTLDQNIIDEDGLEEFDFAAFIQFNSERGSMEDGSMTLASSQTLGNSADTVKGKRPRPQDLKMEGPLTPQDDQSSPFKKLKTVSFMEDLVQTIPSDDRCISSAGSLSSEEKYEKFFDEVVNLAAPAIQETEHEQLVEADSTLRMQVPVLKEDDSVPPWEIYSRQERGRSRRFESELGAQCEMLAALRQDFLQNERPWHTAGDKDLAWVPIPASYALPASVETFDEDGLAAYLTQLTFDEPINSATLVWKAEGLRILDQDYDDEEDLEDMVFDIDEADLSTLVQKRYSELAQPVQGIDQVEAIPRSHVVDDTMSHLRGPTENTTNTTKPGILKPSAPTISESFAFGGLASFMQIQSGKRIDDKLPFERAPPTLQPPGVKRAVADPAKLPEEKEVDHPRASMPLPRSGGISQIRHFLVSSTLFVQRGLVREIERLYPAAVLFERDFGGVPDLTIKHGPQTYRRRMEEADILISPSTGLVITTLQKIKQKALPGQPALSGIRDRLLKLVPRYEHIVVLISEGAIKASSAGPQNIRTLDQNDCDALSLLMAFTSTLDAEIQTNYVPGGESELSAWIVSMMTRYGVDETDVKLVQDETLWEVFLRNAGMNAFAAQAVLSKLKIPEGPDVDLEQDFGLSALVKMTLEERLDAFGLLLGGERVLRLVSRVLDSRWVSATGS